VLDPGNGTFNPNNYFMETSPTSHSDAFAEFQSVQSHPFDVGYELGLPSHQEVSPPKEPEPEVDSKPDVSERVKDESPTS
jgi:hypothetical protein